MTDYTKYDYNALVERATELLKDKNGWGNAYASTTGQELIQLLADTADQLHYMLERRSQEMYIDTARLDTSVIARASEFGYRPRRAIGARGTVLFELVDSNGDAVVPDGNVIIPQETSMFYDGIEFITLAQAEIKPPQTSIEIEVVQGTIVEYVFDPADPESELALERFVTIEDFRYLDDKFFRVFEGTEEYTDVIFGSADLAAIGAVSFAESGERYYDLRYPISGMRVIFGDAVSGTIPTSPITVRAIETQATQIEIVNTLNFTLDTTTVTDDVAVIPANEYIYRITNNSNITNSFEPETVESIRLNATSYIRTNNRAVSREDYRFWVLQAGIGGIIDAEVFGEQEVGTFLYNANNVYISYLTLDGMPLSPSETTELRNYMYRIAGVTVHMVFKPANIIKLGYDIQFRRHPNLQISDSELHDVIRREMTRLIGVQTGSIGSEVQKSDIIDEFYRARITRNGITYRIIDFMNIELDGYYAIESPFTTNVVTVSVDSGATINDTEEFVVDVDGTQYSVIADSDTPTSIVAKMRDKIFLSAAFNITLNGTSMKIKSFDRTKTFAVDVSGGDLSGITSIDYVIIIPPSTFINLLQTDLFVPGSLSIVDDAGTVYYEDDGSGLLVDSIGSNQSGTINYVTGEIGVPVVAAGNYFIKFKQNIFDNFTSNEDTAIDVIDARTDYLNVGDLKLSTITLV